MFIFENDSANNAQWTVSIFNELSIANSIFDKWIESIRVVYDW